MLLENVIVVVLVGVTFCSIRVIEGGIRMLMRCGLF